MIIFYLTLLIFQYHISVYESSMNLLGLTKSKPFTFSNGNNNNNNNNVILPDGTFDIDFTNKSNTRFHGKALKIDIENLEIFGLGGILRIFNSNNKAVTHYLEFDDSLNNNNIFKIMIDHHKISYLLNKNMFLTFDFSKPDQAAALQFVGTARFYDVWMDQLLSRITMINLCRSDRLLTGYSIVDAELCNTDVSQTHLSLSATLEYISNVLYAVSKDYTIQNKTLSESLTFLQSSITKSDIKISNITTDNTNHDANNNNLLDKEEFLNYNRSIYDNIYAIKDDITTLYITTQQNHHLMDHQWNLTSSLSNMIIANLSESIQSQEVIVMDLLTNYTSLYTTTQEQQSFIDIIQKDIEYLQVNLTNIDNQLHIQANDAHTNLDVAINTLTKYVNESMDLQSQQYKELVRNLTDNFTLQTNITYKQYVHSMNQSIYEILQQYYTLQRNITEEFHNNTEQHKLFAEHSMLLLSNEVDQNLTNALNINKEIYDSKFIHIDTQFKNISEHFSNVIAITTDNNTLIIQEIVEAIARNEVNTSQYLSILITNTSAAIARSNSILAKVIREVNISVNSYREEAISFVDHLNKNFLTQVHDIHNELIESTSHMDNVTSTLRGDVINHINERLDMIQDGFQQTIYNTSHVLEQRINNLTNQMNDAIIKRMEGKHYEIDLILQKLNNSIHQNSVITNESLVTLYHNLSTLIDDTIMRTNISLSQMIIHQIQSEAIEPLRLDIDIKMNQRDIHLTEKMKSFINETTSTLNTSISEYYHKTLNKIQSVNDTNSIQIKQLNTSITNIIDTQIIEYKESAYKDIQRLNHSLLNHCKDIELESYKNISNLENKLQLLHHEINNNNQSSSLLIKQSEDKLISYVQQEQKDILNMMNTSITKQTQMVMEQYQIQTSNDIHKRDKEFDTIIQELKELILRQNQRITIAEKLIEDQSNEIKLLQNYNYQLVKDVATVDSVDQLRRLLFDLQGSMLVHSSKVLDILLQKHICKSTSTNKSCNGSIDVEENSRSDT